MLQILTAFVLCLSSIPTSASLYDSIHKQVEAETIEKRFEPEVLDFVAAFYDEKWKTDRADIVTALKGKEYIGTLCKEKPGIRKTIEGEDCLALYNGIQRLVTEEMRVRGMGRDLASLLAGTELSTSEIYGQALSLPIDYAAVVNLWQAGQDGNLPSYLKVRTRLVEEETMRPLLQTLRTALQQLSPEERPATIQRYRHGVRLVLGSRAPQFPPPPEDGNAGPGTERQYEWKHWLSTEQALMDMWAVLRSDLPRYTPVLRADEVAYIRFPASLLRETLPENVIIWAQIDGSEPDHPFGDIGLAWELPRETVMPSLLRDPADPVATPRERLILGGRYPPALPEGLLCTHRLAERGFNCRSVPTTQAALCPLPADADSDAITLVNCGSGEATTTIAGPDICRDIRWRAGPEFDPTTQCKVEIVCGPHCFDDLGGNINASARTFPKAGDGTIQLCLVEEPEGTATYLGSHELVHAYQNCNLPPGADPFAGMTQEEKAVICCGVEGEAYTAQAGLMERDGVFRNDDGSPVVGRRTGIPIDAATFAETYTNFACSDQQGYNGCPMSRSYPPEFAADLTEFLLDLNSRNPGDVPVTCSEWKEKGDPRTDSQRNVIENKVSVCSPDAVTRFENGLVNNMCFIGECAKQIYGELAFDGRTPFLPNDDSSPWLDPSPRELPGGIARAPAPITAQIPTYTPARLVQQFDASVCELVGFPIRTPMIQCLANEQRRLELPLSTAAATIEEFLKQQDTQSHIAGSIGNLAASLGREKTMLLFAQYLKASLETLASSLSFAADELETLKDITFPDQMCPLNAS